MTSAITSRVLNGAMAELVDALVLGTNIFGCEGSSPFRPTKNDYANNYDMLVLSTKKKKKVWYTNRNMDFGSLRKNHTFHLNNTCANYSLSTRCFFNFNSTTHLWWSCRRFTKTTRRRTRVSPFYKEMFL